MSNAKYIEVIDFIRDNIDNKIWDFEQPIPTERQISDLLNISRSTVRKSINILIQEGYLISQHGRGTFIMPEISRNSKRLMHSFSHYMSERGYTVSQKILQFEFIKPSKHIADRLKLSDPKQKVLLIKRVRTADGQPVVIQNAYVPIPEDKAFTQADLEQEKSLYKILYNKYNLDAIEAEERITARKTSTAEQQILGLTKSESVLNIQRTTISNKRTIMEYCEMQYLTKLYEYKIRITKSSL